MSPAKSLQAQSLAALPGIRHGFFTRDGGVSQDVYATSTAASARTTRPIMLRKTARRMAQALGVAPDRFLTAYQIHSPDVVTVERAMGAGCAATRRRHGDTHARHSRIGVSTADCGPVLFADPQARVIGAAHAGWRGAFTGVLEATIAAMEKLGAARDRITVALGPMIRQTNYEVGPEFVERFRAADAGNGRFFLPSAKRTATRCSIWPATSRRAIAARWHRADRRPRSLHLCRSGTILQLSPRHA